MFRTGRGVDLCGEVQCFGDGHFPYFPCLVGEWTSLWIKRGTIVTDSKTGIYMKVIRSLTADLSTLLVHQTSCVVLVINRTFALKSLKTNSFTRSQECVSCGNLSCVFFAWKVTGRTRVAQEVMIDRIKFFRTLLKLVGNISQALDTHNWCSNWA